MTDVVFLQQAQPGPGSILPAVMERLRRAGSSVAIGLAGDGFPAEAAGARVVALRGLTLKALRRLAPLEVVGVRCCNPLGATTLARRKPEALARLSAVGLPVPRWDEVDDWGAVRRLAAGRRVVVKPTAGSRGAGIAFLNGVAGATPAAAGPWMVQQLVPGDGWDRKLYVVGQRVAGVRRRWPARTLAHKLGEPFEPDSGLRRLALGAGRALGLEVYGVDVVVGRTGPAIVDVNAFPGFKGVEAAPAWVADHLLGLLEEARCAS